MTAIVSERRAGFAKDFLLRSLFALGPPEVCPALQQVLAHFHRITVDGANYERFEAGSRGSRQHD